VAWGRCTAGKEALAKIKEEKDEYAIGVVCEAATLRSLGRGADARSLLETVLNMDRYVGAFRMTKQGEKEGEGESVCAGADSDARHAFKGATKDDYALPAAHYEMAVIAWDEACNPAAWPADAAEADTYRRQKTNESQSYLDSVARWETFVLDARFGMRVKVGADSIRWLKAKKGWT
jgi:hypothetical protein